MRSIYDVVDRETAEVRAPKFPSALGLLGCRNHQWLRTPLGIVCERHGGTLGVRAPGSLHYAELDLWLSVNEAS
jgi:hypothetical protein